MTKVTYKLKKQQQESGTFNYHATRYVHARTHTHTHSHTHYTHTLHTRYTQTHTTYTMQKCKAKEANLLAAMLTQ